MSAEPITILEDRGATIRGVRVVDAAGAVARSARLLLAPPTTEQGERNWGAYTRAQGNEKPAFRVLLAELCKTIPEDPPQRTGRPRTPTRDLVFALAYKVYLGLAGRRFESDMQDALERGFISTQIKPTSLSRHANNESATGILKNLIEGIGAAFSHIETKFAVDSTGFRIPKITQWCDEKHGWRKRREWLKCHVAVGVRSHIVTAVEVTKRRVGDPRCFDPLMERTSNVFPIEEVAADRAYSTVAILEQVSDLGGLPAIPFKSNTNPFRHAENSVWRRMYHTFALNSPEWREAVNRQNQVESTFSQIKRKFGERVLGKDEVAQVNEILCKVLCHNIVVVIHWLYEFGVVENFITEEPEVAQTEPVPIEDADTRERHYTVVESLMSENGLTREQAWAIVRKLL